MKILQSIVSTFLCLAATLLGVHPKLHAASPIKSGAATLPVNSSLLNRPYISIYNYHELDYNSEVTPETVTEAAMHLYSFWPYEALRVELLVRVELLNARNFEQFELRLASALGRTSGNARLWLWRAGSAAEGLKGWQKLSLPKVLAGRVSGLAYPLVQGSLSLSEEATELDILPALEAAGAGKGDLIIIEDLDKPQDTPERFVRVLALKEKHEVFQRELGQGRKKFSAGAYQSKSPAGSMIIFPKLHAALSEHEDGTQDRNISFPIGGSTLQLGLRSLFVEGTRVDGPVTPEMLLGHTVPQKLAFRASGILPGTVTLNVYKGKTLVATMPLKSGGSVDLSSIEDLRPKQFTVNNQYELVMTVNWAGREYGFLELIQGLQQGLRPIPHGASLPY